MIEQFINISCTCGNEKTLSENKISWHEDETCSCTACGKRLSFSHKAGKNSYSFAEEKRKWLS